MAEQMQGMMDNMQGMMEHMQGMMERMQSMMGRGGMMGMGGMMGRRGMMAMMGMGGMGGMVQHHLERLVQQLTLTDAQQAQVRTLLNNHARDAIRLRADIGVMAIDVRQLLETEPIDLPRVKQLLQTMASREADLHFAHITLMQEISKLLTPEQQQKFRSMRDQLMLGHGSMPGHEGMMGHGGMMGRRPQEQ
jgi:Spy/CpxP family protein refolding chaperone